VPRNVSNRDAADSLGMVLRIIGDDLRTASDGLEAVAIAEEFRPDLVFLDIGLPQLNGYGVAQRIRENSWGEHTILIAVTGWGQDEDRQRSKKAGFDSHMVKPIEFPSVVRLLAELQRSKSMRGRSGFLPEY
jgi:CheY-like chemotaxis protein